MTANVQNLKPPIEKGEHRGHRGRAPGVLNRVTRAMKIAAIDAAELSKHSKDNTLTSYLTFLADEHPAQFSAILCKLIPVQVRANISDGPPQRLDTSMSLSQMINSFEQKIKSDYQPVLPPVIEHDAPVDE